MVKPFAPGGRRRPDKDMDRYGWDIQVLLPTGSNGNFGCSVALKDADLGAAFCRAYNNWAHDYCSADSKRLKFIAVVPGATVERDRQGSATGGGRAWAISMKQKSLVARGQMATRKRI